MKTHYETKHKLFGEKSLKPAGKNSGRRETVLVCIKNQKHYY